MTTYDLVIVGLLGLLIGRGIWLGYMNMRWFSAFIGEKIKSK